MADGMLLPARKPMTMGGHQSPRAITTTWLTPLHVLAALGPFDLDPCAAPEPRPWPTAGEHITEAADGLSQPWRGRVWLNPPYHGPTALRFMRRMVQHGRGTALLFARTETALFFETVWNAATALLFLEGRLTFCRPDGTPARANSGAPSVLIAYGADDAARLHGCRLLGQFIRLRESAHGR